MELLIIVIVLILLLPVIGLMLLGAFGIGLFATRGRRAERQKREAAQMFIDKFDQGDRLVTFEVSILRAHPTKAEVIEAADTFEYRMTGSTDDRHGSTLVFEKQEG